MDVKPPDYATVVSPPSAAPYPLGPGMNVPPYPVGIPHSAPYPAGPGVNAPPYPPGVPVNDPYSSGQPYQPSFNESNNEFAGSRFSDKSIRHAFIRKVYLILTAQLLVTFGFVCLFLLEPTVGRWVRRNSWFYYLSYATFIVTYIALVCCPNVRRRFPGNFIALGIFTLAFSYMTGTIASFYNISSVLITIGITAAVCLAISLFAIQTRIDFTKCTALLLVLSLVLVFTGIACMIVYAVSSPNRVMQAVYGGIAALVFGLYLAFDTQMIMGGRRHELSPEEYIHGALQLYMDIVNLFLIILSLFGSKE